MCRRPRRGRRPRQAIVRVAVELDAGSVLDGTAVDVILAVGEPLEADDGPPTSGAWIAIGTFFTGGMDAPARAGDVLPFHDPRVQAVPELFLSAELPGDLVAKVIHDYRLKAMSPSSSTALVAGPRVVRCTRRLVGRTPGGWTAITVVEGDLVRADAWYVARWPTFFEPSLG